MESLPKKRIGIFANGWSCEYLHEIVEGIQKALTVSEPDVFCFVNFSISSQDSEKDDGEANIYHLPDISEFDGVVLLANSFNSQNELEYLYKAVMLSKVPCVSLEYDMDGIFSITSDNYSGMYEMTEHIIKVHKRKDILYIGGPVDHQENMERYRAVVDACRKNRIELGNDRVCFADWSKAGAIACMKKWYEINRRLPAAVICANDIMATGAIEFVHEHGGNVPEDVIVSGYDCIRSDTEQYFSIASVSHEWSAMGAIAVQYLEKQWNKPTEMFSMKLKSRFVCGESCGCVETKAAEFNRFEKRRTIESSKHDGLSVDTHFRHMYSAVRKVDDLQGMRESIAALLEDEHWMEGDNFLLCLDPDFFVADQEDGNLRRHGYANSLETVCYLKDGKAQKAGTVSVSDSIFFLEKGQKARGGQLYVFVPISEEGKTYGFGVMNRDISIIDNNYLYIWTRHMNQYCEHVRRNVILKEMTRRLEEQSLLDALTGVYNRYGCDEIAYPMLEEIHSAGETGIIMMVDVDRMKNINDRYGHVNGDLSLIIIAKTLQTVLPKEWVISRYGGDEFLIAGKLFRDINVAALEEKIMEELSKENNRRKLPFRISMSIGITLLSPDDPYDIREKIQESDRNMYQLKKKHHATEFIN